MVKITDELWQQTMKSLTDATELSKELHQKNVELRTRLEESNLALKGATQGLKILLSLIKAHNIAPPPEVKIPDGWVN